MRFPDLAGRLNGFMLWRCLLYRGLVPPLRTLPLFAVWFPTNAGSFLYHDAGALVRRGSGGWVYGGMRALRLTLYRTFAR